jgi:hypothetical protein
MKRFIAMVVLCSSFQAFASNELIIKLLQNGMLCNQEEALLYEALENIQKDPNNAEFKKAFEIAVDKSEVCLTKAKDVLLSNNSCTDKIETLLSDSVVCNAERANLESASELHDRAPSINSHIDLVGAEQLYASCSERALELCK